jgi:dihydroorotate dehydrogenase
VKEFIISPPFGHFIQNSKCTRVLGTYTLEKRGGWPKKILRFLATARPIKDGWVNNIGLQNSGIKSVRKFEEDAIYSIAALKSSDWDELIGCLPSHMTVELNLSCPNVEEEPGISDVQAKAYLAKFPDVIFKLSPTEGLEEEADRLIALGAKCLHLCNTLPSGRGGESGGRLKKFSLSVIPKIRAKYPNVRIIGGGGIYSKEDIKLYREAGADHFSLATVWMKPWIAAKLLK